MAKYVLIGGGETGGKGKPYETGVFDREIIRLTGKSAPNFLFIGLASNDPGPYYRDMAEIYGIMYGCPTDLLSIADCSSADTLQAKIHWADIIYVGGGITQNLMRRFRRYGIDELLSKAAQTDKVLCGISAGAICWCQYGQCGSKPEIAQRVRALGHFPLVFCPHSFTQPARAVFLKQLMTRTHKIPAVALDNAALEIVEGRYRLLQLEADASATRHFWKKGSYISQPIAAPDWENLSDLLTK